jgi:hypothetical protein
MSPTPNPVKLHENELPSNATFFWRNGQWLMQRSKDTAARPASKRLSKLLALCKIEGRITEKAPGLFKINGAVNLPLFNAAESPLMRMAHLRQSDGAQILDVEQLRAGERLRVDYEKAHLAARVTARYEAATNLGQQPAFSDNHIEKFNDDVLAARDALHRALDAVGQELSGILLHICCMASGLEQAEMHLNLPRRAGKAVLQLALTRLARHYGYKRAMRHAGPSKIGHWATADFRPGISAP